MSAIKLNNINTNYTELKNCAEGIGSKCINLATRNEHLYKRAYHLNTASIISIVFGGLCVLGIVGTLVVRCWPYRR